MSKQCMSISKLEHDLNQVGKSSSITSRRLETENSDLRDHVAKLEKHLLEEKLRNNDLNSHIKGLANDLAASKQSLEAANTEAEVKMTRFKTEAGTESSRLECQIDKLRLQHRGKSRPLGLFKQEFKWQLSWLLS